MKKKQKKPVFELTKKPIEQVRKEFYDKHDFIAKFFIQIYCVQFKVLDGNYYKTNKDYSIWLKLNAYNPISYLIILIMLIILIFRGKIHFIGILDNIKSCFQWQEESFEIK